MWRLPSRPALPCCSSRPGASPGASSPSGSGLILPLAIRFAAAHVGGQTGDLTGATQQVIEIAMLLVLVAIAVPVGAA